MATFPFFRHSRNSLFKIFFSFSFIVFFVLLLIFSFVVYHFLFFSFTKIKQDNSISVAKSILSEINNINKFYETPKLQKIIDSKISNFISIIYLTDKAGNLICSSGIEPISISAHKELIRQVILDSKQTSVITNEYQDNAKAKYLIFFYPVKFEEVTSGVIVIKSSLAPATIHAIKVLIIVIVIAITGFIIYSLMTQWYFHLRIMRPLNEIISAIQKFNYGFSEERLDIHSSFEFSKISKSFNIMVEQVKNHMEDLKLRTRLATIGETTSELTHELKNKIGSSLYALRQILSNPSLSKQDVELISDVISQLDDLSALCKNFLEFAKPYELNLLPNNLNNLIRNLVAEKSQLIKVKNIDVKTVFAEELPLINIDKKRIGDVVKILLENAIEASKENSTIEINTFKEENKVGFTIKDFGVGMDEEETKLALEPFYTTKEDGTGLGLSIAYKVIKEHNAYISIQSKKHKGTQVSVMFLLE